MKPYMKLLFFSILFLVGLSLLLYPLASNAWNDYRQSRLISTYEEAVAQMAPEDSSREWEAAKAFNNAMKRNFLYGDAFGASDGGRADAEYWKTLNASGDGIMGYLSIPKIHVRLAIYHGVAEEALQTGVGHLNGTKLPIGGESVHSVLAAHRGLPGARLFTDVDQMEQGDRFYLHILNEALAYEVDQILPMVDKDDRKALESALQITEGEDYVTLFTCTPYGVNSHRLLVRGTRVPYEEEEAESAAPVDAMMRSVQNDYVLYLIFGLSVTALAILFLRFLFRPKKNGGKS